MPSTASALTIALLWAAAMALNVRRVDESTISGKEAPLTEKGYQQVAELRSDAEMKDFVIRLLAAEGRSVKRQSWLNGLLPYYSGVASVRSLAILKAELRSPKTRVWIDGGVGRTAPLDEAGYQQVAATKSSLQMKAFARRVVDAEGQRIADQGALGALVSLHNGLVGVQSLVKLQEDLRAVAVRVADWKEATGATVPLTEEGYQRVVKMKSNAEMESFMQRVILREARFVKDLGGLRGVVPYHSGELTSQTFEALLQEIRRPESEAWLEKTIGRTAKLSDEGYRAVAASRDSNQMKAFLQRLLRADGREVIGAGELNGIVPFHSGELAVQSLEKARADLLPVSRALAAAPMSS